ncbi:MAG: HAD-IA family hydrolase [Pseudomonadota bacterium]
MKLVIFDCDGTLADSQHAIVTAMTQAFERHNREAPLRNDVLSVVGLSLHIAISDLLPDGTSDRDIDDLAQSYKNAFHDLRRDPTFHEPLYPGIKNLIEDLGAQDDVLLGVATGKSDRGLHTLLDREGVRDHFATLQTADHHPSKPDPAMIQAALNETGVDAKNAIMIGDTTFDVLMARAASVYALGVDWGYHPASDLIAAGAPRVATSADEIATITRDVFAVPVRNN